MLGCRVEIPGAVWEEESGWERIGRYSGVQNRFSDGSAEHCEAGHVWIWAIAAEVKLSSSLVI